MRIIKLHIIFILCSLFFVSCNQGNRKNGDASQDLDIVVARHDILLNEYVEFNSFMALKKMNTDFHQETKYLIEDILKLGEVNDPYISEKLKNYYSDSVLRVISRDALAKYADMKDIEKELGKAFGKLKKEIPSIKVPRIYSQLSGLNESVVIGDSVIGFSIDKYMGEDYPLYQRYFYDYQIRSMSPSRVVPDCFTFFLQSECPFPEENDYTLLDAMLYRGKVVYVINKILGDDTYSCSMGYSKKEEEWAEKNEKQIWKYMLDNQQLTSTDPMLIRKYMSPAPYTAFFGEDSPSRIGAWVGTRIIEVYMKNNEKVTIKELMADSDYRKIYTLSGFKP